MLPQQCHFTKNIKVSLSLALSISVSGDTFVYIFHLTELRFLFGQCGKIDSFSGVWNCVGGGNWVLLDMSLIIQI